MSKVLIIAEAGVNHNGSLELAKKLVDVAKEAGADIVKFQSFVADRIVTSLAPKANYQTTTTKKEQSQIQMLKELELSEANHFKLKEYCDSCDIEFLSTPFDAESLQFLLQNNLIKRIKIPSGEITNAPLLKAAGLSNKLVILSTGMSTIDEINLALGFIKPNPSQVSLLHCTSEYPAPFAEVNLLAMRTMKNIYPNIAIGLSDHSEGMTVPIAAVALGAVIIEKHFTLDKKMPGPDHKASLEPMELKLMVKSIREVEQSLGNAEKRPTAAELKNRAIIRKSLVAKQTIRKGEVFSETNLTMKRPATGISAQYYYDYLGKIATKNYFVDDQIVPS